MEEGRQRRRHHHYYHTQGTAEAGEGHEREEQGVVQRETMVEQGEGRRCQNDEPRLGASLLKLLMLFCAYRFFCF